MLVLLAVFLLALNVFRTFERELVLHSVAETSKREFGSQHLMKRILLAHNVGFLAPLLKLETRGY